MSLEIGSRIAHYDVTAIVSGGGMEMRIWTFVDR